MPLIIANFANILKKSYKLLKTSTWIFKISWISFTTISMWTCEPILCDVRKKKWLSTNYSLNSMNSNSTDEIKLKSFKKKWIKIKITKFNLLLNKNLVTIKKNNHLINIQIININDRIKILTIMSNNRLIRTSHFIIKTLFIKLFNIRSHVRVIKADNQSTIQIIKIIKIKVVIINN